MKLRQKLALTMAAAMLVSAAPMVMAGSTNHVISAGQVVKKDAVVVLPGVSIEFKDAKGTTEEFFLELEGAEWINQTPSGDIRKEVVASVNNAQRAVQGLTADINAALASTQAEDDAEDSVEEVVDTKNYEKAVAVYNASYANVNVLVKTATELNNGFANTVTTSGAAGTVQKSANELTPISETEKDLKAAIEARLETLAAIEADLDNMKTNLSEVGLSERSIGEDMAAVQQAGFRIDTDGTWVKNVSVASGGTATIKYTRQSGSVMKVEVTGVNANDKVTFPMPVKTTAEEVKVTVNPNGGTTSVTGGTYTVVAAASKQFTLAAATGDDVKHFYNEGELSKITLNERYLNSFFNKGQDLVLRIELDNDEFEFDPDSNVKLTGKMGYTFQYESNTDNQVWFAVDSEDKATGYVIIDKNLVNSSNTRGRIEITGIKVRSFDKEIELGDLLADITAVENQDIKVEESNANGFGTQGAAVTLAGGAELDKEYKDVVLAKVEKYGATITMKDEKAVDIIAGREQDVQFTVKENVDDVFVGERTLTLSLKDNEGAADAEYFMLTRQEALNPELIIDEYKNNKSSNIVQKVELTFADKDGDLSASGTEYAKQNMVRVKEIKVTFLPERADQTVALNKNDERDSFTVKTKVYVPVGEQDKKTIDVVGELRGEEVKAATAVNVIDPFDVTFDTTTVKVGLQDQVINTYSIKETDKEMLQKGTLEMNFVANKKGGEGITLEAKGSMDVTEGTLKKASLGEITQGNKVDLKRLSKAAATLTFKDAKITVDRTVPEGSYDLQLSGKAIDKYDGSYTVSKFLNIGTQNTQDIQETNGLSKVEAVFTVGANKYMVEGVEAEMDATPYIQDGGNIMVPVRYVSEAFGVKPQNILVNGNVITIFAGNRTIQLTVGSNVAVVNGTNVEMSTKVVIKEGRTYIPAGQLAKILGLKSTWNNETKTATFNN